MITGRVLQRGRGVRRRNMRGKGERPVEGMGRRETARKKG